MTEALDAELAARLAELSAHGLHRTLRPAAGRDFASNDYLGLASHPGLGAGIAARLAERVAHDEPLAAPASRLLRGTTPGHLALEQRLAQFKGSAAALLFPSGYQANLGLLTALVGPTDRVLSDELNHASLIDALRLARPAVKAVFPHADVTALARWLAQPHPGGRTFVVTESLFSMDGDLAPLAAYAELAARHGAELIVDEAHATGLYGARRSGLVEALGLTERVAATVSTFGKSLAFAGAAVTGSQVLIDYLVNRSRAFIFSTAPPPLLLLALDTALDLLAAEAWRGPRALALAARLRAALTAGGLACAPHDSPIVPVVLGGNERALGVALALQEAGFDVRAVRPPTVPAGTARLRVSVHADHGETEIDQLAAAILAAVAREPGR